MGEHDEQPGCIRVTREQAIAAYNACSMALIDPALLSANAEWLASRGPILARWQTEDTQHEREADALLARLDGFEQGRVA